MTELTPIKEEITTKDDALLWTMEQTAEKLAVSPKSIRRLIDKGEIAFIKVGRTLRIEKQSVYHFIEVKRQYNTQCVELVSSLTGENKCDSISEMASIKCPTSRQVDTRLDALLKPVTKP